MLQLFSVKCVIFFILFLSLQTFAQQRLLLVGGGQRPPAALKAWIDVAATAQPKVMIITWASEIQPEVEASLKKDFKNIGVNDFLSSQAITVDNKAQFLSDLKEATHIFFSGGDQKRIMKVLQDKEIFKALKNAYWKKAKPVAGTSAGTAVQSAMMIQGDHLPLAPGLGFLPHSVTDQHFFKRHREERLRAAMTQVPDHFIGVGVDEDGAILFSRDPQTHIFSGQVLGDKNVMYIEPKLHGQRYEHILKAN